MSMDVKFESSGHGANIYADNSYVVENRQPHIEPHIDSIRMFALVNRQEAKDITSKFVPCVNIDENTMLYMLRKMLTLSKVYHLV